MGLINAIFKKTTYVTALVMVLFFVFSPIVSAQSFTHDLYIGSADVRFPGSVLNGGNVRIYVTVRNDSNFDLSGVVKFYDERISNYVGPDQPISVLAGGTDDVFIDWTASILGNHPIAVRVVPWQDSGDNPDNNKVTKNLYVDTDSDGDGIGDRNDPDDDNDGNPDATDDFPFNPIESTDSDGDGIGDNADDDDDNDGYSDIQDQFPLDPQEWVDSDADGVGDNADPFPADPTESRDSDGDGLGDNKDPDDANHGPEPYILLHDTNVQAGKPVTLTGLRSTDPDGEIVKYEWEFSDGTKADGVLVEHAFADRGDYLVTLSVTDDRGETRHQEVQVKVGYNKIFVLLIVTSLLLLTLVILLLIPMRHLHIQKVLFSKRDVE